MKSKWRFVRSFKLIFITRHFFLFSFLIRQGLFAEGHFSAAESSILGLVIFIQIYLFKLKSVWSAQCCYPLCCIVSCWRSMALQFVCMLAEVYGNALTKPWFVDSLRRYFQKDRLSHASLRVEVFCIISKKSDTICEWKSLIRSIVTNSATEISNPNLG